MKLLMGQCYTRVMDPKENNRKMPYPPLGSILAATYLKTIGYNVEFFDNMITSSPSKFVDRITSYLPDILILYDDEFNYLTKMSLLNMRDQTFEILKISKDHEIITIVYTSDAIDHPDLYLNAGAIVVIIGEGEVVLQELLDNIIQPPHIQLSDTILFAINGISYLDNNGKLVSTDRKPLLKNLDLIPDPNFQDFVDVAKYRNIWIDNHGYFSMNISTSRGCTYGCNWCSKPLWGRTYNALSAERVALQMKKLQDDHGVDHIWITDDIFGLKKDWLQNFAKICQDLNIHVPYKCLSRADLLLKDHTLKHFNSTGCETIWIGAESGSQKILDAMDKGITVEQIKQATVKSRDYGIKIAFFLQFGYLGETWDDIQKTRQLIKECLPDDIGISVSYPLPGTKFYELVQNHLKNKQNWLDSDDLDMLFHGTYSRKFYKILHKLIHNEYRLYHTKSQLTLFKIPKFVYHSVLFALYSLKIKNLLKKECVNLEVLSLP